jgi:hypothetical protein
MTRAELAVAVLKRLAVLGAGDSADADDSALVLQKFDTIYPQLRKLGLAPFSSTSIDAWAEGPMVKIIAAEVGPEFGWADRTQLLEGWRRQGENELSKQIQNEARNRPVKAEYI